MGLAALVLSAMVGLANGLASTDTITWGGDNSRASYQDNHNMDPAVVASSQFGQLFRTTLPGNYGDKPEQSFSQPLVYTPSGSDTQFVYYSTTQNNVYKINAKTGEIILSRNLAIPFLSADLDGCQDISPHVGIIGTGVIDPSTDTLYLTTKTYADQTKYNVAQGRPAGRLLIHALDVNTLESRPNFPINLEGITSRNAGARRTFNGGVMNQRPGLLHVGQYIYIGFGSHCVQYEFSGWLIGVDKVSGKLVERFTTQGDGVVQKGASIWMSGGGLASDGRGSIFYATGNGYESQLANIPVKGYAPPTALEEAAVHMSINEDGTLDVVDFFMPYEKQELDGADNDLGTSPLQILPSQFSCGAYKRIGVVTGKSGKTYWINLDDMGGYRNGPNNLDAVIQTYQNENSVYAGAGVYPLEGGYIYINVIKFPSHAFKFSCTNGVPRFTKVADSPYRNAYILGVSHGTTTSLNGQPGTGLLWVTDTQTDIETLNNVRVFDAIPDGNKMKLIKSWTVPGIQKFTRPVFGDGIMYFGTTGGYLYGYGAPTKSPLNCTTPNEFGAVDIKATSEEKTITCKALIGVTVTGVELKSALHYSVSGLPTVPLQLAAGGQFTVKAKFQPGRVGFLTDDVLVNTTNSAQGYRITSSVRLTGTGASADALFDLNPTNISFANVVSGNQANDLSETVVLTNQGAAQLTVSSVQYSTAAASGPFQTWTGTGDLKVGKFIIQGLPKTIAGNSQAPLVVKFDSTENGKFAGWVKITTNGGSGTFAMSGSAGPAPVALLEFEKPDGSGWTKWDPKVPFSFGNVYQNTAKSLKFRITNNTPQGGVRLSLLVSKPPTGGGNLVRAANQVDLAEGIILEPGESQTAVMICAVPKAQWNTDSYNGTSFWTMNTNDMTMGKQSIPFFCNAIAQQAAPLKSDGQGRYRYIGCFKESDPGRQLSNQLYGDDNNDAELCIDACNAKGATFCGAQYHRECWAGNMIPRTKVSDSMCNYDCSGDIGQMCGGNGEGEGAGGAYISLFADSAKWDGNLTRPDDGSTTPAPGGPVVNPGVNGYTHIGCYTESPGGRALPNGRDVAVRTVANCVSACKTSSFKYAGLEYGGECWCGNAFGAGAVPAPAQECNVACNNNATELCGGGNRLNVYQLNDGSVGTSSTVPSSTVSGGASATSSSASATATAPSVRQTVGKYSFEGCYVEPATGGRAIEEKGTANNAMTLEMCAAFCDGYKYFGTEYGSECFCGNTLRDAAVPAKSVTECSFLCPGDQLTYCGAGSRLSLYKLTSAAGSSSSASSTTASTSGSAGASSTVSTSSASPSSTGPSVKPLVNGEWVSKGCYVESPGGKALSKSTFAADTMTLEACATFCKGSKFFGVEYGRECYCGDSLREGAAPATKQSDCNFLCPGDKNYLCGAGDRLQLYELGGTSSSSSSSTSAGSSTTSTATSSTAAPSSTGPSVKPLISGQWASKGCYVESPGGKALSKSTFADDAMTLEACATFCKGSKFFGVEYGRECYCGDSLREGAAPAAKQSDCNFLCPGDKNWFCGAGDRLQLYEFGGTSSSSSGAVSSTSSGSTSTGSVSRTSTATSSTAAPSSTKPAIRSIVNGEWGFQGCYTEGTNVRALAKTTYADDNMTPESCATFCKGSVYAGVEYGRECYCGDSLGTGSVKATNQDDCSFLCPGDKMTFCGGSNRLQLFKFGDVPKSTSSLSAAGASRTSSAASSSATSSRGSTSSAAASSATSTASSTGISSTARSSSSQAPSSGASTSKASTTSASASSSTVKPSTTSSTVKPSTTSSTVKPSTTSSTVKPSTTSSTVKPSTTSSTVKPSTTSSTVKPSTTSSSVKPSTTSSSVKPSTTSSSVKPSTTSSSVKPSTTSATSTTLSTSTKASTSSSAQPSATGPVIWQGNSNFTYYSCVSEPSDGRLMQTQILNDNKVMTNKLCAEKCWQYNYSGVEFGQECWCSNTLNWAGNAGSVPGKNVTNSDCSFLCPGDNKAYCGAGNRLSLYINKKIVGKK